MTKEEQRFNAAVAAMRGMLSNPEIMRAKLDFFKYQTVDSCIKMSIQYADALIKEMDNDSKKASIGINDLPYIESFPSKNRNGEKTHDVNNWISVEKQIPPYQVLCINYSYDYLIGYIGFEEEEYFCENNDQRLVSVTHWMQLPEPPNIS